MRKKKTKTASRKPDPKLYILKKGPNGRNLCRSCQVEVTPPRRTFCSDECVHLFRMKTDWSYLKKLVKARDKGICRNCGLDCKRLKKELRLLRGEALVKKCAELDLPLSRSRGNLFDIDHVIPIADGGEAFPGLEGLLLLCYFCHRDKTRKEAKERAKKKKLTGKR